MSTSSPIFIDFADNNHAKRSCRQHQNFGKPIGSQNANQHGDPHSPPRPVIIVPLQIGKTESISRPVLVCGLNQWIGDAKDCQQYRQAAGASERAANRPCVGNHQKYESVCLLQRRYRVDGAFLPKCSGSLSRPFDHPITAEHRVRRRQQCHK